MCGITGFQGNFPIALLEDMGNSIMHRGPDAQGNMVVESNATLTGLAHTRLSIIDLSSSGCQPMTVECQCCQDSSLQDAQKLWLIYNGELYNYKALRDELVQQGHTFRSQSDTEVILHLYAELGLTMLNKLNGIFAFALYDGRPTGQKDGAQQGDLVIARDGVGIKPLYYSQTEAGFLFSSELKSLLCSPTVSRDLDYRSLDNYLTYLWSPGEGTLLKAVKKLLPGHGMLIRGGKIARTWEYYDIPIGQGSCLDMSFEQAAVSLKEHLAEAVHRQMVADVPIGAFLSGGLDSSAIVALMRQQNPQLPIDCFTIRVQGKGNDGFADDLPYAQKVASHLKVDLHIVDAQPDMIMRLPEMLYHLDEPQADPAPINALMISELAQAHGIKVLMSGAGGDDLFTGYRRHMAICYDKYWKWLPLGLRSMIAKYARQALSGSGVGMANPKLRRLAKLLKGCDKSDDPYLASFFGWSSKDLRTKLYTSKTREMIGLGQEHEVLLNTLNRVKSGTALDKMLYLELKHFLADHNLNYTDKMSMAKGVEVRVPLLDPDLIRFAFTLPDNFKQRGKVGKAIFKKAMEPLLPKEVIYRPKTGFGAPLRQWLHGELKDVVNTILSEQSLKARGLFDAKAVAALIQQDKAGKADAAYTIFSMLCIEIWCRQFVDVKVPEILTL